MIKLMGERSNIYLLFLFYIIFLKIVFLIASTGDFYLKFFDKNQHPDIEKKFKYWEERTEFLFVACMSALLLIMFFPHHRTEWKLNKEERLMLYLFGWILLYTANWKLFIDDAAWYPSVAPYLPSWLQKWLTK
jgi:hypothetical protein